MSGTILILTACVTLISILQAFDVQIERPEVHYVDKQFYKYFKVSVQLFENLSGRYLPTMVHMQWKMCDFFNNEPYVGQLLKKHFPSNLTCPHKAGLLQVPAVEVQFEKFPYVVPLTWPFKMTSARCDLTWKLTESKKPISVTYIYMKIINNSGAKTNKTV